MLTGKPPLRACFGKEDTKRMAITREKKNSLYSGYLDLLDGAQGMVISEYRGMTMKEFNNIRKLLRPMGTTYAVVKTSIFKKTLKLKGFAVPEDLLFGPVAVAIARTDLAKTTKALLEIKDAPLLVLKGAVMGESVYQADQLDALSKMPTFEQARAMLLGTLKAPAGKLVTLLAQPGTDFARILKAYSDKEGGSAA
jgi:large subunit ribosomal protein L10